MLELPHAVAISPRADGTIIARDLRGHVKLPYRFAAVRCVRQCETSTARDLKLQFCASALPMASLPVEQTSYSDYGGPGYPGAEHRLSLPESQDARYPKED